jgi:site-specific recombinase XerC
MNLKTSNLINKAIELYIAYLDEDKQNSTRSNLKSALKMTVFKQVDFGQKQLKEFGQVLEQIAIAEFLQQAQDNFNSFIDKTPKKKRGKSTVRNYKSHFKRFISWLLYKTLN